jgi:hypothetical protein
MTSPTAAFVVAGFFHPFFLEGAMGRRAGRVLRLAPPSRPLNLRKLGVGPARGFTWGTTEAFV